MMKIKDTLTSQDLIDLINFAKQRTKDTKYFFSVPLIAMREILMASLLQNLHDHYRQTKKDGE